MKFESPFYFVLLFLPVFLGLVYYYKDLKTKKQVEHYFSEENAEAMGLRPSSKTLPWLFRLSLLTSLACLVVALARPQLGARQATQSLKESAVVFLVDLSRSMLTKDVSPSRLSLLKRELLKSLEVLGDVRVGLVVFAGSVDVISPMTSDLSAISSYVNSLSTKFVYNQGTQVQRALEETEGVFERSSAYDPSSMAFKDEAKLVVLFSDGEDHQEKTLGYAKQMAQKGYKIFSVGVGSEAGGYVPESLDSDDYIKDSSGQAVISKPNFSFLRSLAQTGKGSFFYLSPTSPLGPKLKQELQNIESAVAIKRDFIVRNEIYQVFLLLSLFFLVLSFLFKRIKEKN